MSKDSTLQSFVVSIPDKFDIEPNLECDIAGYGSNQTLGANTELLYTGKTKLISNEECASSMSVKLAKNTVCTKNEGTTPCGGDSGGPLICQKTNLIGVVSHGPTCQQKGSPSVYAFTPKYSKWIKKVMDSYSLLAKS